MPDHTSLLPVVVVNQILAAVSAGQPVRKAIKERGADPFAFYRTLKSDDALDAAYGRAKMDQLEPIADEAMEIADDPTIDPLHKRIMVDTRKWLLAKLAPKKYGDKLELGGRIEIPVVRVRDMTGKPRDPDEPEEDQPA